MEFLIGLWKKAPASPMPTVTCDLPKLTLVTVHKKKRGRVLERPATHPERHCRWKFWKLRLYNGWQEDKWHRMFAKVGFQVWWIWTKQTVENVVAGNRGTVSAAQSRLQSAVRAQRHGAHKRSCLGTLSSWMRKRRETCTYVQARIISYSTCTRRDGSWPISFS